MLPLPRLPVNGPSSLLKSKTPPPLFSFVPKCLMYLMIPPCLWNVYAYVNSLCACINFFYYFVLLTCYMLFGLFDQPETLKGGRRLFPDRQDSEAFPTLSSLSGSLTVTTPWQSLKQGVSEKLRMSALIQPIRSWSPALCLRLFFVPRLVLVLQQRG